MYRTILAFLLGALVALTFSENSVRAEALPVNLKGLASDVLARSRAPGWGPASSETPDELPAEPTRQLIGPLDEAAFRALAAARTLLPPTILAANSELTPPWLIAPPAEAPAVELADAADDEAGLHELPDLAAAAINDEPGVDRERMRPIDVTARTPEAISLYPANERLLNPFGQNVKLACEGLMEWLAPRRGGRWHSGLDLVPRVGRTRGSKLYAPGDGFVLRRRDWHPAWGSYLLAVFRKGDKLYLTGFFHLKAKSHSHLAERNMAEGITGRIARGELLGRVGRTGAARGAHLHLDVIEVRDIVSPDQLPRVVWQGRQWTEFVHPASVIDGLPEATYKDRARPEHGLIVRAYKPQTKARPS